MKLKKHHLKYKKHHLKYKKHLLKFSFIGFKVILFHCLTKKKIDFLKLLILKKLKGISKKKVKIWFFSNCFFNSTQLPPDSRMGKGKGEVKESFGFYKKGFILFEIKGISTFNSIKLLKFLNNQKIIKLKLIL
uniref:ribosomal protein L16 n=1 Tax=Palisada intermedia TaxID=397057 RepID=UPI00286C9074|nr:ribosomal protein L16 [Palisada intermedia]WMC20775.1 ribosomal protein L16 [Palisada intermedia]